GPETSGAGQRPARPASVPLPPSSPGSARPENSVGGLSPARPGSVPLSPSRPGAPRTENSVGGLSQARPGSVPLAPSCQEAEDGDAARHAVANAHAHIGPTRHHAVGAGAEADHAEALARGQLVPRADAADDPPRDRPRDLDDRDARGLALQVERTALVRALGLGPVGREEAAPRVHRPDD